jgi:hypothetical protein
LLESMQMTIANLQPEPERTVVFTDDKAQIEWLTNGLVLNYFFTFGTEDLQ